MGALIKGLIAALVPLLILAVKMLQSQQYGEISFSDEPVGHTKEECPYKQPAIEPPLHQPISDPPEQNPLDSPQDFFTVPVGQLTFEVEGNEGGPYHSRKPDVPTDSDGKPIMASGLTIGRGYDMGQRSSGSEIVKDLVAAGLTEKNANKFRGAAGLQGTEAIKYLKDNELENFEISPEQQYNLFNNTYKNYHNTTVRIIGQDDWDNLDPNIQTVLVDVVYKGEFKGKSYPPEEKTWRFMADGVNNNSLESFLIGMKQLHTHQGTDENRIDHRLALIKNAIAEQEAAKTNN